MLHVDMLATAMHKMYTYTWEKEIKGEDGELAEVLLRRGRG